MRGGRVPREAKLGCKTAPEVNGPSVEGDATPKSITSSAIGPSDEDAPSGIADIVFRASQNGIANFPEGKQPRWHKASESRNRRPADYICYFLFPRWAGSATIAGLFCFGLRSPVRQSAGSYIEGTIMKRICLALLFVSALLPMAADASTPVPQPIQAAAIYIVPTSDGFQVSLMAAMQKKHVPVALSSDAVDAQYVLESSPVQVKTQSTGSKFARCLFADCIGIQDRSSVAVQLTNAKSKQIVWAYTVHKQRGGAMNDQSMAEAVAKHLKEFMQKHPLAPNAISHQAPLSVDTEGKK